MTLPPMKGSLRRLRRWVHSQIGASIALSPSGMILYSPPADAFGREPRVYSDEFEYTVNDQYSANVHISLASITAGDSFQVDRPISQTLHVLENDHFGAHYAGPGRITAVSTTTDGGTLSISSDGLSLLYQPAGVPRLVHLYGRRSFHGNRPRLLRFARLQPDRAVADQNGPDITVEVLANDFRESALRAPQYGYYFGSRTVTSVTQSEHGGLVSIHDSGNVSYQPPADYRWPRLVHLHDR